MQHKSRIIALTFFGVLTAGCYNLLPAGGAAVPASGTPVVLEITDLGRVSLGGQMGPEIARVEGKLVSGDASEYRVSVSSVNLIHGGVQVWSGENVLIKRDYVNVMYTKRLAKGKTVALSSTLVAGVIWFALTRDLFGSGGGRGDTTKIDTVGGQNFRGPRQAPPVRRFKFHGVF